MSHGEDEKAPARADRLRPLVLTIPSSGTCADNSHPAAAFPFNAKIRNVRQLPSLAPGNMKEDGTMDGLIYLIGLIVVIMAILSFFGLR